MLVHLWDGGCSTQDGYAPRQVETLTSDEAIREIQSWLADVGKDAPVTVGVDGHSAAGKSTFASRLTDHLNAALVNGDHFYRVMEPGERARLGPAEGVDLYYDWERMRDEALAPLYRGDTARYRPYDWDANTLGSRTITVAPRQVVIVEGLFVSRPDLDSINDLVVLIVADPQVRRGRQLARSDASDTWLKRWDAAERWYFDHVRPPKRFDVIVNGMA